MEQALRATLEGVYDAAVSAAAKDAAIVSAVVDAVSEQGFRVFDWSRDSKILWGQPITDAIEQLLTNQVGCVLVFLSDAYSESEWCQRELGVIRRLRDAGPDTPSILPVRLDSSEVPRDLQEIVWLDARSLEPTLIGHRITEWLRANTTVIGRVDRALDDNSLAKKALTERDPEAFSLLAQRLLPLAYVYARKYALSSPADVDDIVQDALMCLFTSSHTYDPSRGSILAYLLSIIRNSTVHNFRRKTRHRREAGTAAHDPAQTVDDDSQEVDWEETLDRIRAAMDDLPPLEREIVIMRMNAMKSAEISEALGISESSVSSRYHRALMSLRIKMREMEQSHG